ncbi:protein FAM185A-like [Babylonia areolata]|uniref:protein FAM185A-like n=1 Tax=Babylonia areolata TaxID=304850 RepID=UPI003FD0AF30
MAKFVSKVLQFSSKGLRRSFLSRLNGPPHRRTIAALFGDRHCCHVEAAQWLCTHRICRDCPISSDKHSFHTHSALFSSEDAQQKDVFTTENLIGAWFDEINTFGTVHIRNVPFDIHIQPLNPLDYPELNKTIVKLYYNSASRQPLVGYKLSEMGKLSNTKVCVEGGRLDVSCDVPQGVQLPLVCVITVPLKFDVDIEGSGSGSVTIRNLESDSVRVHLKHGDCHLTSLKTGNVTVQCDDGSIISSKQLLGSISLRCGSVGSIRGERLQGTSVDMQTEAGDVDVKTVYADRSSCRSQSGNLHVRDCHGDMTACTLSGNLTVDSLDGRFSADLGSGSADVYVTRQEGVDIRSQTGDITLRFSEDGSSSLDLDAPVIERDDSLPVQLNDQGKGCLKADTEHTVRASAPQGKICLKKQDWLSAIKLQFGNTTP